MSKTTHPDPQTEPLDGCPACLVHNNAPHEVERPDANTKVCHYICRACGQDWQCSWWEAVAANA